MIDISIRDILDITRGRLIGDIDTDIRQELLETRLTNMVVDSRLVNRGSLFVATLGERVDGHKFVPEVLGITNAVMIEEDLDTIKAKSDVDRLPENAAYIRVNNTVDAMQQLARHIRMRYDGRVVGVTGSVGKTTTREMITSALSSSLPVYHTRGNMNSQIGVPIILSDMRDKPSDAAVIEMGISEPGGMDRLAEMVSPDIAVVTVIGDAHIEFMGSKEGIRNEKLRITSRMKEDGVLFINADDPLLYEYRNKTGVKTFTYGTREDADYRAADITYENGYNTYTYIHDNNRIIVNLSVLGRHNVINSLVAMAICDYLGLDLMKAAKSFEHFQGLRQRVINSDKGYKIIDDSYNASPDSMKAALNVLRDIDVTGKRIAVLGDMFELGENSIRYHKQVGDYINELCFEDGTPVLQHLITIGNESSFIDDQVSMDGIETVHFEDREEALKYIRSILEPGDVITFKASNGMKFGELLDRLD